MKIFGVYDDELVENVLVEQFLDLRHPTVRLWKFD
jgi:hypothetical protein